MKDQLHIKITRGAVGWQVLINSSSHEVKFSAYSPTVIAKLIKAEVEKTLKEKQAAHE
jgi:predicted naringenin-chalcone synthase